MELDLCSLKLLKRCGFIHFLLGNLAFLFGRRELCVGFSFLGGDFGSEIRKLNAILRLRLFALNLLLLTVAVLGTYTCGSLSILTFSLFGNLGTVLMKSMSWDSRELHDRLNP